MFLRCSQNSQSEWTPKRALFTETTEVVPTATEVTSFRERIENLPPFELMVEFRTQGNLLWQKQQAILEVLEDFASSASIDQVTKNAMVMEISQALEQNARLTISDEQKAALASYLRPGADTEMWMAKLSLLGGAIGHISAAADESSGNFMQRIQSGIRWIRVLFAVLRGHPYNPQPSTAPQTPPGETANEGTRRIRDVEVVENQDNANAGYLTVNARIGGSQVTRLIKFDGSEMKAERNGAVLTENSDVKTLLMSKLPQMNRISGMAGITDNAQKVALAKTIVVHQRIENQGTNPIDIAQLINDHWLWAQQTEPRYSTMTNAARLQALLEVPASGPSAFIQALKTRYEVVRTREQRVDQARRDVRQKFDELTTFLISKLDASDAQKRNEQEARLRTMFGSGLAAARSLQEAPAIYSLGVAFCMQEFAPWHWAQFMNYDVPTPYGPGRGANHREAMTRLIQTFTYFSQQANPQRPPATR